MTFLGSLLQDARFALRLLKKSPAFTIVAILTLALGIGANSAIFSVVYSVLLRSLPFSQPEQLVGISARSVLFDFPNLGLSLPDLADVRAASQSFSSIAVFTDSPKELSGQKNPQRLESTAVTEDFFPMLGLHPIQGRVFTSADMQPGQRNVILSYSLWRDTFGSDPNIVGKSITLDGQPQTILGVMPAVPEIGFATDSKLWTAFQPTPEQLSERSNHAYSVLARLKPGATLAGANAELDTISSRLASTYSDIDKGWSIHTESLAHYLLGDARAPLAILFCAVGFVLLIACANVSNLFLARGFARRREFAIRSALGASRAALMRQLILESVIVAVAGGICAFLFASWTLNALRSSLPPDIPRLGEVRIDSTVIWFTLAASFFAALLSGLAPAFLSTRNTLFSAMKDIASGTASKASGHNFLRQSLVVAEVALAAVLLIGATLTIRSFSQLLHMDLGMRPDNVLTLHLDFAQFRFPHPESVVTFVRQVLDSTRAVPGVSSCSVGLVYPMSDEVAESTIGTEETVADTNRNQQSALFNRVAPDFFQTLGIPFLAGRDFAADGEGKSPVVIVNEALAKKYFGKANAAIGRRMVTDFSGPKPVWSEIAGVVSNVAEANHFDPSVEPKAEFYLPFNEAPRFTGVYLVVRTAGDPRALLPAIQDRIWSIDKNQPITEVATLNQRIATVNASPRSQTILLGIFAALGFLLALIGVYGVMSYLVGLQTREIGIRMALGAAPGQVLRLVLGHGLKLTLAGVALGLLSALALTRFMSTLLFGISSADPITYAAVSILLIAVGGAAILLPARRASRIDPMRALRQD